MPIAFWCVLIAGVMPYIAVGIAKADKRYDNSAPRDWLATREGAKKRAYAAHLNSFEAFPLFASGVVIAHLMAAPVLVVNAMAIAFVLARIVYIWCYITNHASLRSLVWLVGFGLTVALFVVAGLQAGRLA